MLALLSLVRGLKLQFILMLILVLIRVVLVSVPVLEILADAARKKGISVGESLLLSGIQYHVNSIAIAFSKTKSQLF